MCQFRHLAPWLGQDDISMGQVDYYIGSDEYNSINLIKSFFNIFFIDIIY